MEIFGYLFGAGGLPLAGHFVSSDGFEGDFDASGYLHFTEEDGLIAGDYMVTFSSPGYIDQTINITIEKGKTTEVKVYMVQVPPPPPPPPV